MAILTVSAPLVRIGRRTQQQSRSVSVPKGWASLGTFVYGEPFLEGIASFAPDTGIIVGGMDAQYVKLTTDPAVFAVGLDEVPPERGMLVSVGIEDEVVVDSNDTTYIVRLRSHWFLESVELTTY